MTQMDHEIRSLKSALTQQKQVIEGQSLAIKGQQDQLDVADGVIKAQNCLKQINEALFNHIKQCAGVHQEWMEVPGDDSAVSQD